MPPRDEFIVLVETLYGEARGEFRYGNYKGEGLVWIAWVIFNRAYQNRSYWGGDTVRGVCLQPGQFECWNGVDVMFIDDADTYERIEKLIRPLYDSWIKDRRAHVKKDPTGGCDHYNNPDKEGYPAWTRNCDRIRKIGNHQFYRSRV